MAKEPGSRDTMLTALGGNRLRRRGLRSSLRLRLRLWAIGSLIQHGKGGRKGGPGSIQERGWQGREYAKWLWWDIHFRGEHLPLLSDERNQSNERGCPEPNVLVCLDCSNRVSQTGG